ncbi:MAG: branched-chain amino acid ABC transporter permease [Microthrixaceae bacterium]
MSTTVTPIAVPEVSSTRMPIRPINIGLIVVGLLLALVLPHVVDTYWLFLARTLGINFIAAAALNVLQGNAGQFSLGNAAFLAVGSYSGAFFWVQLGLPLPVAFVGVALAGALVGLVVGLPALRLHGIYLLMSSLAAHFIVVFVASRYQVANFGVAGVPYKTPGLGPLSQGGSIDVYYLILIVAVLVALLLWNLLRSAYGRALVGVRDRDVAAAACGIAVGRTKLVVWSLTSSIVAVAGLLQAMSLGTASIEFYTLGLAITFVAMTLIGGHGSLLGSFVGAVFVTGIPEVIATIAKRVGAGPFDDSIWAHPFELQRIAYGAAIVLFILLEPDGLVGLGRRFVRWLSGRRSSPEETG